MWSSWSHRLKKFGLFARSMITVNRHLFVGMWKLTRLPQPAITFFGGARLAEDHPYSQKAAELARDLAKAGYSIITGGGPGIMQAANLGAFGYQREKNGECETCPANEINSFGIALTRLNHEKVNPYVQDFVVMEHFFERKWLLVRYSCGFAVFPGGFGTLDELMELVTLIQTSRMPKFPIVLMGVDYWKPFWAWVVDRALAQGMISKEDLSLVTITDSVEEALKILAINRVDPHLTEHKYGTLNFPSNFER